MSDRPRDDWPTAVFRVLHPSEAGPVRGLLGLDQAEEGLVFVLVDGPEPAALTAVAGVAIAVCGDIWLVRAAYGVEEPSVAARVGRDLMAAAVRAGAIAIMVPPESSNGCRSLFVSVRGDYHSDSLVVEL